MQTNFGNLVIKLHINDKNWVIATYKNGRHQVWGEPKNERGAKIILSKHARRLGLIKSANGRSAA